MCRQRTRIAATRILLEAEEVPVLCLSADGRRLLLVRSLEREWPEGVSQGQLPRRAAAARVRAWLQCPDTKAETVPLHNMPYGPGCP